jgi:hypothetical protein
MLVICVSARRRPGDHLPPVSEVSIIEGGLAGGRVHQLHYFASTVLHDGIGILALAEYLGHADPGFTPRVYTQLMRGSPDWMRQA